MNSKAPRRTASSRTPMGERTHETHRADRGRTGTSTTPVVIRGAVDRDGTIDAATIRLRLGAKLGKFAWRIDRIDVGLSSQTPAKGAADAEVTITAKMSGAEPVVVRASAADVRGAFQAALRSAERALRRGVEKKRRSAARAAVARKG